MRPWNTKFGGTVFAASFAMIDTKRLLAFFACLGMFFWSTSSYAVVVGVDQFSVSGTNSSGAFGFTDNFDDGNAPPCGPAAGCTQTIFYGVNSTSALSESGGLLQLDSSNGISTTNAGGGARLNETVQVGGSKSQLLDTNPISMSAIFTLPTLSGPLNNGYGIRLIDSTPGGGNSQQVLELDVQYWTGNGSNPAGLYIRYLMQDFNANTITTIGADALAIPAGADEIYLSLDDLTVNGQFDAQYAYVTSGTLGALASLGSEDGFLYQNYVRPQFHAFETVTPIPATLPLFASGLGAFGLLGWRRKKKARAAA